MLPTKRMRKLPQKLRICFNLNVTDSKFNQKTAFQQKINPKPFIKNDVVESDGDTSLPFYDNTLLFEQCCQQRFIH